MHPSFKSKPVAAAVALLAATSILVACGGGGSSVATTETGTPITVSGAGNSPFVGVTMQVDCANGATGTAVIGVPIAGDGVITTDKVCTGAVKLSVKAGSIGKMRPIGAAADGSQDVSYDPAINIPIANIFDAPPAAGVAVTANPVTAIIAEQVAPAGTALNTVLKASIDTKQAAVEQAFGLDTGTAGKDYRDGKLAAASTRISEVAAIAATTAAAGTTDTGTKTLGEYIANAIAAQATSQDAMKTATNIADKIRLKIDVTGNQSITSGAIENDALKVNNLINTAAANATVAGATVADMLKQVSNDTTPAVILLRNERAVEIAKAEVQLTAAKMVQDVKAAAANTASSGASLSEEQKARIAVAKDAATKIVADTFAILNALSGKTAAEINTSVTTQSLQTKAVATNVQTAIANDAKAATADKLFTTPPDAGSTNNTTVALIANLQKSAQSVTSTTTAAQNASNAADALKVVKIVNSITFAPPPVAGVPAADTAAYYAAVAAVVSKIDPTQTLTDDEKTNIRTTATNLQAAVKTAITANSTLGALTDAKAIEAIAKKSADDAVKSTINFATPPTIGAITTVTYVAPVVTLVTAVDATVMTAAQKAIVEAAVAKLDAAVVSVKTLVTTAAKGATDTAAANVANDEAVAKAALTVATTAAEAAKTAYTAAETAQKAIVANLVASDRQKQIDDNKVKLADVKSKSDAAVASAAAAKTSYDALVTKLFAAQKAIADAAVTAAQAAADTAKAQAAIAKTAADTAATATTSAAAQTQATAAAAAAATAETAAGTAKAESVKAAAAGLPAGSDQEKTAAAAAVAAQTDATAAKASAAAAAARVIALTTTTTTTTTTTATTTSTTFPSFDAPPAIGGK